MVPRIQWARSATKHRISKERSRHVIEGCGLRFEIEPAATDVPANADTRLLYLGDDADGVALEVMAVELADGALHVIHAMHLRDRYADQYEEAKKWRR